MQFFRYKTAALLMLITGTIMPFLELHAEQTLQVIANEASAIEKLSEKQVYSLYLGKQRYVNGQLVNLFDMPKSSEIRSRFYRDFAKMKLPVVNAYWARLQFTGKVYPPRKLSSEEELYQQLGSDENAIGYISPGNIKQGYKVICCD